MALKAKNTEFLAMKAGDKAAGYLVGTGLQLFPSDIPGQPPSEVPTMVLQREDGTRYKILLGSTVRDDVGLLAVHVWTEVRKLAQTQSRKGRNVGQYQLLQDDEKVLRAK